MDEVETKLQKVIKEKDAEIARLKVLLEVYQKNIEKALQENTNYFENIIAHVPGLVYWLNKDNVYQGCNDTLAQFVHLNSRKDIVGKTNKQMPWSDDAQKIDEFNNMVMNQGKNIIKEEVIVVDNNTKIFISEKMPLLNYKNEVIGIVGISIDITDRKKMEEELRLSTLKAEAANQAKEEFISNMEHDLKTPFSGIGGIANLLYGSEIDPSKKEFLGLMVTSCAQWENVHHRIFDSLIVEDPTAVTIKAASIHHELMEIKEMMSATLFLKKLDFIIDHIADEYDDLETDPFKFRIIISSLISNAINFTEHGSVRVTVGHDNNTCFVSVTDTGIGIPEDKLDYIFEKFTKLSKSNLHGGDFKGVGLGLYTARQYATQLGGSIDVESILGNGATFTLRLPLKNPIDKILNKK